MTFDEELMGDPSLEELVELVEDVRRTERHRAAALFRVSEEMVDEATLLIESGDDELIELVEGGEIDLSRAVEILRAEADPVPRLLRSIERLTPDERERLLHALEDVELGNPEEES